MILYSIKYFFRTGKLKAVCTTLIYFINALFPAALLLMNKKIFELMSLDLKNVSLILFLLVSIVLLNIITRGLNYLNSLILKQVQYEINIEMKKEITKKLYLLKPIYFEDPKLKDILTRITGTIPNQTSNLVANILSFFSSIIQIVTSALVLLSINIIIPVFILLASLPYIFLFRKMNFDNYFMQVSQTKLWRKNWYLIKMMFDKSSNKELKFYNIFDYLGDKQEKINYNLNKERYIISKKYSIYGVILDVLKTIVKGISIILTVSFIYNGMNISALTVLIQAVDNMQGSLLNSFNMFKTFDSFKLYFKDFMEFKNLKEESNSKLLLDFRKKSFLEFCNVNFKYPNSKKLVLDNINIKINPNERIAIVGENGSGKTTFANLLLGFFEPESGEILVNGDENLKNYILDLRKNSAYIMQDYIKYNFSVKDNIFMGSEGNIKYNYLISMFKFDKFLATLDDGENTNLGSVSLNGRELSGGEWQRLAIIRSCIKDNIEFYVLDEPTASLDPFTESEIYKEFNTITQNKTTVFISHRLGITQLVDRILVFKNGKIVEDGNHKELMELNGVYANMFNLQKSLYA